MSSQTMWVTMMKQKVCLVVVMEIRHFSSRVRTVPYKLYLYWGFTKSEKYVQYSLL